jgi:GT2 family glycosyltransferase
MSNIAENQAQAAARSLDWLRVLCRPDASGTIDAAWLDDLRAALPGARLTARPDRSGAEALEPWPGPELIDGELLAPLAADEGLLVLRSGLRWRPDLASLLTALSRRGEEVDVLLLPGNYHDDINPLAALPGVDVSTDPHSLLAASGSGRVHRVRPIPSALALIPPDRVSRGQAAGDDLRVGVSDDVVLIDPARPLDAGRLATPEFEAAFGVLRQRLAGLLDGGVAAVPEFTDTDRPLTLHISHSWGGGVARWIRDQCQGDDQGRHLVLCAGGEASGREHGQHLRLYSGQIEAAPLAEWPLVPAIADTAVEHPAYADLLQQIIRRYGVGRVVVSSLIGHSLDALRTGCPTLVMLHDFYPLTPLLHEDPLDSLDGEGRLDLAQALARQRQPLLFEHADAAHWAALGEAWIAAVQVPGCRLAAPTRHVAERWAAVTARRAPPIEVLPHGFLPPASWPRALNFEPDEGEGLRLVVVGRISEGKGLRLLDQALDALQPLARITLLGAGRDAFALFGRPGVDIVLNYRTEELPRHLERLRPDAVLFLSTVPETWNYVLSEIRALGVTPMATRLGSFEERIDEGVDGVLFDPVPDGLVDAVRAWRPRRDALRALGRQARSEPTLAAAAAAYRDLLPERQAQADWSPVTGLDAARTGLLSEIHRDDRRRLRSMAERIQGLEADLGKRTDWAQRSERLAQERTDWARSLEALVEQERVTARELSAALERSNRALRASQVEVIDQQARIHGLTVELDAARAAIEARDQHLQLIGESLSWRLTRPLRFGARLGRKARELRVWNPLRWPRLAADGWRLSRREGLAGWLAGLYPPAPDPSGSAQAAPEAAPTEPVSSEPPPVRPVTLERSATPRVSVVIPVYNKVELTSACLNSLVEARNSTAFEVIVIDDCSSDETEGYLSQCQGLRAIRNEKNAGFIDSCNRGAAEARGEFVVFLNNDTTVSDGWLDALIAPFDEDEDVGIVGARLIYPDGRLQEAGGIVFNDASGWNYGKGDDPAAPQYGFLSEADYVSGACLAVRRADFEDLGGFDTRFRPAYYEDTDLCFQLRARGKRVLVQPACTVVHHEGATSGTDEHSGAKRYQAINRERFREKWAEVLIDHPPPEPDSSRADPVRHLRYRRFDKRALVLDATTPQPDHDSGSVRIRAVMDLLLARGFQVTFMAENRRYVPGYTDQLTQAGIEVLHAPAAPDLDAWLSEHGGDLDLIFASRHYVLAPLLARLRLHAEDALLVFDTVDLHYLREQREAELLGDDALARQAETSRQQELRLVAQADVSLVVSPVEQALLQAEVPGADVRVLSNIHRVRGLGAPWSARSGLLFVGGFQHLPNVDAAQWLAKAIFPLIRAARPDMDLHLVGSRMPESILALDEIPGIVVHGFVEDLEPLLNSVRASVAPLRYGAGVKGKVNQAMSHGLPVVATSCAAEGMYLDHERDVLIADQARDFADEVIRLDQDEALWNRLAEGGLANVEAHFSIAAADAVLAELETTMAAGSGEGRGPNDSLRAAGASSTRREARSASAAGESAAAESD